MNDQTREQRAENECKLIVIKLKSMLIEFASLGRLTRVYVYKVRVRWGRVCCVRVCTHARARARCCAWWSGARTRCARSAAAAPSPWGCHTTHLTTLLALGGAGAGAARSSRVRSTLYRLPTRLARYHPSYDTDTQKPPPVAVSQRGTGVYNIHREGRHIC